LQYRQLSYTTPGGANLDNQVGSIFAQRCASCHGAGKAKGVQLFTRAGGLFTVADRGAEADRRSRIAAAVAHEPGVQPMPKNGAPLSGGDVDVIRRWALAFTSGGR
jgi:mono/diheme cytochrome c family protein